MRKANSGVLRGVGGSTRGEVLLLDIQLLKAPSSKTSSVGDVCQDDKTVPGLAGLN